MMLIQQADFVKAHGFLCLDFFKIYSNQCEPYDFRLEILNRI